MECRSSNVVGVLVAISLALTASSALANIYPGEGYKRDFKDGHVRGTKCSEAYTNHPEIDGKDFVAEESFIADGSFYGNQFHNRNKMPSGNKLHECDVTVVAYNALPLGTILRATNPANGKSVILVVQDRGGSEVSKRPDLSRGASEALRNDDKPAHGVIKNIVFEVLAPTK